MARRSPVAMYELTVGTSIVVAEARTPGCAARVVFRHLIREGHLKRQPETDTDNGWFKGVSIRCLGAV